MRQSTLATSVLAAVLIASYAGATAAGEAGGYVETDLVVNKSGLTDKNGIVHNANIIDPDLRNPWGISRSATSPFWVSDNASHKSTLYNAPAGGGFSKNARVVNIPSPGGDPWSAGGTPTGTVFNATTNFNVSGVGPDCSTSASGPANFLFATEDGTIVARSGTVNPPGPGCVPANSGNYGFIMVNNSSGPNRAVYKGLEIATHNGATFLYAANFRGGTVDVFDANFHFVKSFTDPDLPDSYAPFNVVLIGGRLFVTFAMQDADKEDDVAHQGHGFVDAFDLEGNMLGRFAQHGQLNSPWGVALAPAGFGELSGALLIGNFGNGHINAYDFASGEFLDKVRLPKGQPIVIDGLWALKFGSGQGNGGVANTLYFTAGPNDEKDGLFGSISPGPP